MCLCVTHKSVFCSTRALHMWRFSLPSVYLPRGEQRKADNRLPSCFYTFILSPVTLKFNTFTPYNENKRHIAAQTAQGYFYKRDVRQKISPGTQTLYNLNIYVEVEQYFYETPSSVK